MIGCRRLKPARDLLWRLPRTYILGYICDALRAEGMPRLKPVDHIPRIRPEMRERNPGSRTARDLGHPPGRGIKLIGCRRLKPARNLLWRLPRTYVLGYICDALRAEGMPGLKPVDHILRTRPDIRERNPGSRTARDLGHPPGRGIKLIGCRRLKPLGICCGVYPGLTS